MTDLDTEAPNFIIQYKPEHFPGNSQRIRAAFEQLDKQLRHGRHGHDLASQIDVSNWAAAAPTEYSYATSDAKPNQAERTLREGRN